MTDRGELVAVARAQQERAKTLKEMAEKSRFFFRDPPGIRREGGEEEPDARDGVRCSRPCASSLAELADWQAAALHEAISGRCRQSGVSALGKVAQPIRVAVAGGAVSPPIDVTLEILGARRRSSGSTARSPGPARDPPRQLIVLLAMLENELSTAFGRIGLHREEPVRR